MSFLSALRRWPRHRWVSAAIAAVATAILIGIPTDVIPNPWFGRQGTPVTWWSYPVLGLTAVLSGMLIATYTRAAPATDDGRPDRSQQLGSFGGFLSFFAVGCPICNKVVVLALGTSGAITWFAPIQPYLGLVSLGLVGWALVVRLRGETACPLPRR